MTDAEVLQQGDAILAGNAPKQNIIGVKPSQSAAPTGAQTNILANTIGKIPGMNFLLGGAINTAQDIGSGIRNIMEQPTLNKNEQMAKQLETQAMQTNDMQQRKNLLMQANQIRRGISGEATNIAQSFTPDVNQNPIQRGVIAGTQIAGAAELPALISGGANLVKNAATSNAGTKALDIFKNLFTLGKAGGKQNAGKAVQAAADKATGEGVAIKWPEMQTEIKTAVQSKFGNTAQVNKALNNLLAEKTPASLGEGSLNPSELLQWRQQIGARNAGGNFLENYFSKGTVAGKVEKEAQRVISQNLKGLAPDISKPDMLFSFYKKMHGDAPTWAKRIIFEELLRRTIGNQVAGIAKNVMQ